MIRPFPKGPNPVPLGFFVPRLGHLTWVASETDIKMAGESMAWIMALVFVAVYGLLAALVKVAERIMSTREGASHG